jgi:hypothetical protein
MKPEQLAIFRQELDKQGLASDQWETWLEQASEICFAYAETLRQTEPYAHSTISALKEVEEALFSATEEGF